MKKCFKCLTRKSLRRFYRHRGMLDGYLGKCIACTKKDVRANYALRSEQYKAYEKVRNQRVERKEQKRRYDLNRKRKFPNKHRANKSVSNAIRDGRLIRQPCEKCGSAKSQAHHPDYRRPLFVKWLCLPHHREEEKGD